MEKTAGTDEARALAEATDRLRRAQTAGQLGTWDWNVLTNDLVWDGVEAVHGLPEGSFGGTFEGYLRDMHPEDKERVLSAIGEASRTGSSLYVEYRIILPDSNVRWVAGRGTAFVDGSGATVRMAGTCQDITDRKLAEQRKQELFSFAAHELRSPLTTILGFGRILQKRINANGDAYDDLTKEGVSTITREGQRMAEIVEAFLDLARADTGQLDLKPEAIDLKELLDDEVESARLKNPAAVIGLNLPPEPPVVVTDGRWLRRIMANLIQNGVKYGGSPPEMLVTCDASEGSIEIRVKDNGAGISAEDRPRLFERFFRGSASESGTQGLGIGLHLSREFAHGLGGDLELVSPPGEPAEFILTLPA